MRWLDKLERKFGYDFGISNLMTYICASMGCVYLFQLLFNFPAFSLFSLVTPLALSGQPWRLITFIFLPPYGSLLTVVIAVYFYYFIGSTLERAWGTLRFNVYYLCGVIGAIVAALISGYGDNTYLNLSLFLAFAMLFPEQEVLLFFLIPIKVKYLAMLNGLLFLYQFVFGAWQTRAAIIASLINFFLFFGMDFYRHIRDYFKYRRQRQSWRDNNFH